MNLAEATNQTPEFSLSGKTLPAKVVACYDGDTFNAVLPLGETFWKFSCRMGGYDTPEMKPPKDKKDRDVEKARAIKAKQALLTHLCTSVTLEGTPDNKQLDALVNQNTKVIQLVCGIFDKYGRLLVEVPHETSGTVNQWMIDNGYGYKYEGGTKDTTFATKV
jgi:endonuclease YncB( thermonuclease family)